MAGNKICAGCMRDKEEEKAVLWCNDCEEPVCRPCSKVHRRFAMPHEVIDIKDISKVRNKSKTCKDHPGPKYIFFCVFHDKIICPTCLFESHKECDNINHIEKAAKGIKESSAIHDLKERIHNQKGIIEKVKEEYNELSSRIGQDKEQQHERLTQLRSIIEDLLNRLDKHIKTYYNQTVEKISSNTNQLKSLAQTNLAHMHEIGKAETEESEVNSFHIVKHLDTSQLSNEENLRSWENNISTLSLKIIPDNFIENVDAMFNALGPDPRTMIFKSKPNSNKVRQSQLHVHPHEIEALTQTRTFHSDESSRFYACFFFDENKVLIIEDLPSTELRHARIGCNRTNINLRIINLKDGKYHSFNIRPDNDLLCKDKVCTFDRNNALLVGRTFVFVIDLEYKTIGRKIQLETPMESCKWITCIKSEIVVLIQKSIKREKAHFISWIDYNGLSLRTLNLPGNVCDLDIYGRRVYCTFNDANHVTCTSFSGETTTCYASLDLRESCKIAVGESMIFLLEKDRNSIYTIDIKTKQRSTFLKDEITNPTHMVLNRKTKALAVTCDGGNCLKIFNTHLMIN